MALVQDGIRSIVQQLRLRELAAAASDAIESVLGWLLPAETVQRLSAAIHLEQLVRATMYTAIMVGGLFLLFFTLERLAGKKGSYRSRNFARDVLYAFFYQGGFYSILIWAAIANAMEGRLEFLKIGVFASLPAPVHWILYWLVVDFITYWWHRWLHSSETLWAFHSVHHNAEDMSFISSYRLHPFEQIAQNVIMVAPLLVMGIPPLAWPPLYAMMMMLEAAQHSALDWGYGKAYYLVVSPRFHSVHHSIDPRHHHRNFSKILSFWDFLFGTGLHVEHRPPKFGVDGLPVPRSLRAQLVAPFQILLRRRRYAGASVSPSRTPAET
jgi:sterol desaturase/sphingolipid hydroxylase (fatty acid hydroxylase superfamily)